MFALPEEQELGAHGSWWHDRSRKGSLPPYLVVEVPSKETYADEMRRAEERALERLRRTGHSAGLSWWSGYEGYLLMFDLETGALIDFWSADTESPLSRNPEEQLRGRCTKAQLAGFPLGTPPEPIALEMDTPREEVGSSASAICSAASRLAYWLLGAMTAGLLWLALARIFKW